MSVNNNFSSEKIPVSLLTAPLSSLHEELRAIARNEPVFLEALRSEGVDPRWCEWGDSEDQLIQAQNTPVVLIRSTWDYSDSRARKDKFVDWLKRLVSSDQTVLLNGINVIEWNSDKKYLLDLQKAGVKIVPTHFVYGPGSPDLCTLASTWKAESIVIKPAVGASARGLSKHNVSDEEDLTNALQSISAVAAQDGAALIQPFIAEILNGETSVVCIDSKPMAAVLKVPKNGDFRVQEEWGGKNAVIPLTAHLTAAATRALLAIRAVCGEEVLYTRLDFVKTTGPAGDEDYLLMEAECIEPDLFFNLCPDVAHAMAERVAAAARRQISLTGLTPRV
jgi:glutathione synthase/RimK-type ligase-like ATP-grasp enzyme